MTRARVLLADDHATNRALLRALLETEFEVIGEVHDGHALLAAAAALAPDVVVADIGMPGCDGITAARTIVRKHPSTRVVLVTVHDGADFVERGIAAGALGYVLKHAAGDELVVAVRAALRGERHLSVPESSYDC